MSARTVYTVHGEAGPWTTTDTGRAEAASDQGLRVTARSVR